MDLRSIINSDSNTNPPPPPRSLSKLESPITQVYPTHQSPYRASYDGPLPAYQETRPNPRPSQPPPLQSPAHRDLQSPSGSQPHRLVQSPYQAIPTSTLSGGQFPSPHPPSHVQYIPNHGVQYPREQTTILIAPGGQGFGHPSPSMMTPTSTTPGSAYPYSQFQRPRSSHSSATPTSAQSHAHSFARDSPQLVRNQVSGSVNAYQNQHYQSQPSTPLGPPPSIGRPSPILHRESYGPFPYENHRSQSLNSYGQSQVPVQSPTGETPTVVASPATFHTRQTPVQSRSYMTDEERERSLSVSPKTRLPSQTKSEQMEVSPDKERQWSGGVTPAKRKMTDNFSDVKPILNPIDQPRTYQNARNDYASLNGHVVGQQTSDGRAASERTLDQGQQHMNFSSPTMTTTAAPPHSIRETEHPVSLGNQRPGSPAVTPSRQQPTTPQVLSNHRTPTLQLSPTPPSAGFVTPSVNTSSIADPAMLQRVENTASPGSAVSTQPPARKRQRFESPPIYAQSTRAHRNGPTNPLRLSGRAVPYKQSQPMKQEAREGNYKRHAPYQGAAPSNEGSNGHPPSFAEVKSPKTQPLNSSEGALGPWEFNIKNVLPAEELTRTIADFLFNEVVNRNDVGFGPAGGGSGSGAVLEIEAKLGQLVDKNTNDRLRLPVMTECVISKSDPNLRVAFKSSMTEAQHKALNVLLNKALTESLPKHPPGQSADLHTKPRVPMTYVHTRECDSFYELSQSGELALPPSIRAQINPRHNKPKVRITTDQKTGQVLAKIVKVRVVDLDVYNPRSQFDWRLSVNLEMNFEGNMNDLVGVMEGGKRAPERNKDRMTYRHLAYQIDLTQVSPFEAASNAEKEHELEIEISSAELRKHGNLLRIDQPNGYEDLVKGYVDNVRLLTRQFPSR
ncbi:mRNA-capping enzyme subunit beta [Lambiella insularis]|nr:mRNA-capping enzyme subunit beta [Lambiella insularis]